MFQLSNLAKLTAGNDGGVLIDLVDLRRVATEGKDERES
jgi:hypothetical protein